MPHSVLTYTYILALFFNWFTQDPSINSTQQRPA